MRRLRRRRRLGLRARFAAALMATSVATLVGAALALLPPLDRRLELDRLHTLEQVTRQARPEVGDLAADQLAPGAPALQAIVHGLARRVGGRVSVLSASGATLADSDPEARFSPRAATRGPERHKVVREGHDGAAATVSARVATPAGIVTIAIFKPLGDTRAALGVVRGALPVAALAGLLVALALTGVLSRTLLTRLARLRDGARRLVHDGLAEPLPADAATDEVGELTRALELMRSRLHEDARARHAFLTTASHELRTPLASLGGMLELLAEDLAAQPAAVASAARRAGAARDQARQLTRLTSDLLDLGRLDADIPPRHELVDVGELAAIVAGEFAADRERLVGDRLSVRPASAGGGWALGDPVAIVQILRILVDNALAHGPAGGRIAVRIGAGRDRTLVTVRDDGPGIDAADRERVFARFERGSAARSGQARGGFGLGLAIARGLATRMGGALTLDATAPTTFRLALTAAAPPPCEEGVEVAVAPRDEEGAEVAAPPSGEEGTEVAVAPRDDEGAEVGVAPRDEERLDVPEPVAASASPSRPATRAGRPRTPAM